MYPQKLRATGADIHFDQLEFAYGDKTVLEGISLTVPAGQLVALVGPSGLWFSDAASCCAELGLLHECRATKGRHSGGRSREPAG